MKNRRLAVKALIILVAVVAVCMVFSGTVQNILTPKVRVASVKNGKLNRSVSLTGKLPYSDNEDFYFPLSGGETCLITQVYVRAGDRVEAGTPMFAMSYQDPAGKRKNLLDAYTDALEEQLEFERKNGEIRLNSREESYAKAYYALQDAILQEAEARRDAAVKNLLNVTDETALDEEERGILEKVRAASAALDSARRAFQDASRYNIDEEVWSQIISKKQMEDKVAQAEKALEDFEISNAAIAQVTAPHAGYIVEVPVKTGDSYDGISALCVMTTEGGNPQIACEITDSDLNITKGNTMSISTPHWGSQKAKVAGVEMNRDGNQVALINLRDDDDVVTGFGSLYAMSSAEISVKVSMEVASNASLVPSSAVHGAEGDRYVYVIHTDQAAVGSKTMKVEKVSVTVIAEADGTSAVREELSYSQVAYMEDRELSDGSRVMEYLQ